MWHKRRKQLGLVNPWMCVIRRACAFIIRYRFEKTIPPPTVRNTNYVKWHCLYPQKRQYGGCWWTCATIMVSKASWCVSGYDDVIKCTHFPRYWPFVRGIYRSPVNSPHKGQWRGALMFSLIFARINGWVNNGEAGDLRRHRAHYNVIVMRWCAAVYYNALHDRMEHNILTAVHHKKCARSLRLLCLVGIMYRYI